jgi:hypothetical protein
MRASSSTMPGEPAYELATIGVMTTRPLPPLPVLPEATPLT